VTFVRPTGFSMDALAVVGSHRYLFSNTPCSSVLFGLGSNAAHIAGRRRGRDVVRRNVADLLEGVDALSAKRRSRTFRQLEVELPLSRAGIRAISWDDVRRTAKLGVTFVLTRSLIRFYLSPPMRFATGDPGVVRRLRQETDASVPCFVTAGKAGRREFEAARRAGLRAAVTSTPLRLAARCWGSELPASLRLASLLLPTTGRTFVTTVAGS